jgi:hypothetical protein
MTTPDGELFDATPWTVESPTATSRDELSAGQRLTLRQANDITNGRHPLAGAPLHPNAPTDATRTDRDRKWTCGTCVHRKLHERWAKCDIGPQSRGPATDVRAWWPGCIHHEGPEGTTS